MSKALLFTDGYFQPLDNDGNIVPGGTLTVLNAIDGTTTTLYTNSSMTTTQSNPVSLDGAGRAQIFMEPGYYIVTLKDADGATVWTITDYLPGGLIDTIKVDTIADLKDIAVGDTPIVADVLGYHTVTDTFGGTFRWNPTSSASVDDGIIIASNKTANGRWTRIYTGPVNVGWFGAYGDSSHDDTDALNNALKYPQVVFNEGNYYITEELKGYQNSYIEFRNTQITPSTSDDTGYPDNAFIYLYGFTAGDYLGQFGSGTVDDYYIEGFSASVAEGDILGFGNPNCGSPRPGDLLTVDNYTTFPATRIYFKEAIQYGPQSDTPIYKYSPTQITIKGSLTINEPTSNFHPTVETFYGIFLQGFVNSDLGQILIKNALPGAALTNIFHSKFSLITESKVQINTSTIDFGPITVKDSWDVDITYNGSFCSYGPAITYDEITSKEIRLNMIGYKTINASYNYENYAGLIMGSYTHHCEVTGYVNGPAAIEGEYHTISCKFEGTSTQYGISGGCSHTDLSGSSFYFADFDNGHNLIDLTGDYNTINDAYIYRDSDYVNLVFGEYATVNNLKYRASYVKITFGNYYTILDPAAEDGYPDIRLQADVIPQDVRILKRIWLEHDTSTDHQQWGLDAELDLNIPTFNHLGLQLVSYYDTLAGYEYFDTLQFFYDGTSAGQNGLWYVYLTLSAVPGGDALTLWVYIVKRIE